MQDRLKQSNEENNVTYIVIHVTLQKYLHLSHFKKQYFLFSPYSFDGGFSLHCTCIHIFNFVFYYIKYKDAAHNKKIGCIYNYTTRDQTKKSIKQKIVLSLFRLLMLPPPPPHLNGKCNCIQIILTPKTNEGSTNHH